MLRLNYFMNHRCYATKTRKLDKEISRMSEDLDALAEGLMRLEDEVSSLKPKKRGRPKRK